MTNCGYCEEEINYPLDELAMPHVDENGIPSLQYYHLECKLRMVLGSIGHLEGRCHCYRGEQGEEDPPGLSKREAAKLVFRYSRHNRPAQQGLAGAPASDCPHIHPDLIPKPN